MIYTFIFVGACLLLGCCVFIFLINALSGFSSYQTDAERLEEEHQNIGAAEDAELISIVYKAMKYPHGSEQEQRLLQYHDEKKKEIEKRSKARFDEIWKAGH